MICFIFFCFGIVIVKSAIVHIPKFLLVLNNNLLHSRLVNPDYAWIVKPVLKIMDSLHQPNVPPGVSPKHTHDGEMLAPAKVSIFLKLTKVHFF